MSSISISRCRALLREGGVSEDRMSDDDVRTLRDSLATLADILLSLGGSHQ